MKDLAAAMPEKPRTFEEWWESTSLGVHSTFKTTAKVGWHARDSEVAACAELLAREAEARSHVLSANDGLRIEIAELKAQFASVAERVREAVREEAEWWAEWGMKEGQAEKRLKSVRGTYRAAAEEKR